MPLRVYAPDKPPCRLCGEGFEIVQAARDPVLKECPRCGQPIHLRTPGRVALPRITAPVSVSEAKAAGFTVLKRTPGGEFEKQ
jgi:hypothetical protein